jgi:hypothetical protein
MGIRPRALPAVTPRCEDCGFALIVQGEERICPY